MLTLIDAEELDANRIWLVHEAPFHLNGFVSRQNCEFSDLKIRISAKNKIHQKVAIGLQDSSKVSFAFFFSLEK